MENVEDPGLAAALAFPLLALCVLSPGEAATMTTMELGPGIQAAVEEAKRGVIRCHVTSPYQPGTTLVRILPPDKARPPERRRVLFVLPVEPAPEKRWGDGFETARKLKLHNRFGFVVVAPSFAQRPWYADHPTNPLVRQETYLLDAVVPLVERLYPHKPARRLLLGFSKSGWGAFALLLRHGERFGAAVAWDAPMMMTRPRFGMGQITATQENFERYRVARLLAERADSVKGAARLALLGYGNFRGDTRRAHELMGSLAIPHLYADGPKRKHHWDGGWVGQAAEALDRMVPK